MDAPIKQVIARAFEIPTDEPESDGTLEWESTTLLLVEIEAAGLKGLGYTYADRSLVSLVNKKLTDILIGKSVHDIPAIGAVLWRSVRNLGRSGLAAMAISAIDTALWDLKAKLLGLPLVRLLGRNRDQIAIYGSGGFTCYSDTQLSRQLSGWIESDGCHWVKMKVGTDPERDPSRVKVGRDAIGDAGLFVDANGAYSAKLALRLAAAFAEQDVRWFEEPVSSDDVAGLALLRRRAPKGMDIAAGEYGYTLDDFRRLLEGPCIDVLQADATRCGGVSGFLRVGALCAAHHVDLSAHCAPALHLAVACAVPRLRHVEWFHDHVRIEQILFDGAPSPRCGAIAPDLQRPGLGLAFKESDAAKFQVG